ncbi:MAG: enoyl-CoA hydratase/isomerase family protein [Promethearchaeota archaeon]
MNSSENMNNEIIKSDLKSRILFLKLNRPFRGNSLNPPLLVQLRKKILDAQNEKNIRVIAITAEGNKDFCTGIDVYEAQKLSNEQRINIANIAGDIATLIFWGKPVVIAINGRTMGMGVVFSAAADYRIAVKNSVFQMPEVNVGIFPGASCIAIMSKICGPSAAKTILMLGRQFDTESAIKANIIDEIVEPENLISTARKVAKEFAKKNPINLKSIKLAINASNYLDYNRMIKLEEELADWYNWTEPNSKHSELLEKNNIMFNFTGKPDKLIEEYESINKKLKENSM